MIGQKRAREIFFLGFNYIAYEALYMYMVNHSISHAELETEALNWTREINSKSHTAMHILKYGFHMADDLLVGQKLFTGKATLLAYGTNEAQNGCDASFLEK